MTGDPFNGTANGHAASGPGPSDMHVAENFAPYGGSFAVMYVRRGLCYVWRQLMAHTDKTNPTPVKIAHGERVEIHDHINKVCELKADPNHQRTFPSVAHECYLDANWHDPHHRCGCWSCRGSWREQAKREDKTDEKKSLRNWRKEYE